MTSRIVFRPLGRDDFPSLTEWLNTAHVYEWWGVRAVTDSLGGAGADAATLADVTAKYDEELADDGVEHYVIEVDGPRGRDDPDLPPRRVSEYAARSVSRSSERPASTS